VRDNLVTRYYEPSGIKRPWRSIVAGAIRTAVEKIAKLAQLAADSFKVSHFVHI